ncbi:lipopolysaccharide biosynthesis protein [Vibrio sp. JZG10]
MNRKSKKYYFIGTALSGVIGLITVPVLPWVYGTRELGVYSLYLVYSQLFFITCGLAIEQAIIRYYYESEDKGKLITNSLVGPFMIYIIGSILLLMFYKDISLRLIDESSLLFMFLLVIGGGVIIYNKIQTTILRMENESFLFSVGQVYQKLSFLILSLILYFAIGQHDSIINAISMYIFSIASLTIYFAIYIRKVNCNISIGINKVKYDLLYIKRLYSYSIPLVFSLLIIWMMSSVDKIMIKHFLDLDALGVYVNAFRFAATALIVQQIISVIWTPLAMKWFSEKKDILYFRNVSGLVSLAMVIIYLTLVLLNNYTHKILPNEYLSSIKLIPVLLLYPVYYCMSEITNVGVLFSERTKFAALISFLTIFVCALLNYLLIPMYGLYGAALSLALSYYIFFVFRSLASAIVWKRILRYRDIIVFHLPMIVLYLQYKNEYSIRIYLLTLILALIMNFKMIVNLIKYRTF